jgi:hypothetical protein
MRQEANKFWRLTSDHVEVAEERGGEDRRQKSEFRIQNTEYRSQKSELQTRTPNPPGER